MSTSGVSSTPYTYRGSNTGHRWRLGSILVRQQDRKLVRNVTVHPEMKLDHKLVLASFRFVGQSVFNHRSNSGGGDGGGRFTRKVLTSDQRWRAIASQAIVTELPNVTDSTTVLDANDMASAFANAARHMATDTLSRCPNILPYRYDSESPQA